MLEINDLALKRIFTYSATHQGPQYDKDNPLAQANFNPYKFDHEIKGFQTYKDATFSVKHHKIDIKDCLRINVVSAGQEGCSDGETYRKEIIKNFSQTELFISTWPLWSIVQFFLASCQ